jgi:uncharacterized protein YjbI with pentapeptide repeats
LADLTGADLRGANLRATDMATSLFLAQFQVDAANGDLDTRLPPSLSHPQHWPSYVGLALSAGATADGRNRDHSS